MKIANDSAKCGDVMFCELKMDGMETFAMNGMQGEAVCDVCVKDGGEAGGARTKKFDRDGEQYSACARTVERISNSCIVRQGVSVAGGIHAADEDSGGLSGAT